MSAVARVGETEYGGKGGVIQRAVDGHVALTAAEERMVLARQMRAENAGRVNRAVDAAGNVTLTPISEQQALEELQQLD